MQSTAAAFALGLAAYAAILASSIRRPNGAAMAFLIAGGFGSALLIFGAVRYPFLTAAQRAFDSDASCLQRFEAAPESAGRLCGSTEGRIAETRYDGGRRHSCSCWIVAISIAEGRRQTVHLGRSEAATLDIAVGSDVRLQTRKGRIVAISSQGQTKNIDTPDKEVIRNAWLMCFGAAMTTGAMAQMITFMAIDGKKNAPVRQEAEKDS